MDRQQKINLLDAIQHGNLKNRPLRLLCKEALPLMGEDDRNSLLVHLGNPFATTLELYEASTGGVVGKVLDWLNTGRRPSSKCERIDGVNVCAAIHYDEEEKPKDETEISKELEMLGKLSKFKPL